MRIPTKIQHGDKVISTVFTKINGIIDYLNATRTKAGTGIMVQETPSGTVVSAVPKPTNVPVLNPGGSGATGIQAEVSGGTASVTLVGGAGEVRFVGTGAVEITGNTNTGNIEINATGGTGIGAPDYLHPTVARGNVALNTSYGPYNGVAHLIGSVASVVEQVGGDDYLRGDLYADFVSGGSSSRVYLASFDIPTSDPNASISVPVSIIIPSGMTVSLGSATDPVVSELAIYPSL